jgi:hypothetical protein
LHARTAGSPLNESETGRDASRFSACQKSIFATLRAFSKLLEKVWKTV